MRLLLLLAGLGELLRLLLLALIGASRLPPLASGSLVAGAWLLVFLAPHAAVAAAFPLLAHRPSELRSWSRLLVPAKLIGAASAAVVLGTEIASGSTASVILAAIRFPLPAWLFLLPVAAWDLAMLASLAILAWSTRDGGPPPPGEGREPPPPAELESPRYREADVDVVPSDDSSGGTQSP